MSVYDDIVKSPSDDRDYLGFKLSNKLKVVVVSDPTTEKAAASMNVQIGTTNNYLKLCFFFKLL